MGHTASTRRSGASLLKLGIVWLCVVWDDDVLVLHEASGVLSGHKPRHAQDESLAARILAPRLDAVLVEPRRPRRVRRVSVRRVNDIVPATWRRSKRR